MQQEHNDPVRLDYRESHQSAEKATSYHRAFAENPCRSMVWDLEKRILDGIVRRNYAKMPIRLLDFACGTGRIIKHLAPRCDEAVGVDISHNMLEIAASEVPTAQLIEGDLTADNLLGDRKFNLITAFRFFPNAQEELRRQALAALTRHLSADGLLVFNNHKNLSSLHNRTRRLLRLPTNGMSMSEVRELVSGAGLEIVRIDSIGLLPLLEHRRFLPIAILKPFERLVSACRIFARWSQYLVFTCRKRTR